MLLALCGIFIQYHLSVREARAFPPIGKMIDVGGYKLHLYCIGEGRTTVLMEAGIGDNLLIWDRVQPQIAKKTRVCSYDRAGMGWSEPSPKPADIQQHVVTLAHLLDKADVKAPYILVGHSFGGLLNREYAKAYPEDIVGMVLVDSSHENQLNRLPAEIQESFRKNRRTLSLLRFVSGLGVLRLIPLRADSAYPDNKAMMWSLDHQTHTLESIYHELDLFENGSKPAFQPGSLRDVPVIVLSQGRPLREKDLPGLSPTTRQTFRKTWNELQQELTNLSSNSIRVVAQNSGHLVMIDEPELVIDAILRVLKSSENKTPLVED